jgi:hypothetical protein
MKKNNNFLGLGGFISARQYDYDVGKDEKNTII